MQTLTIHKNFLRLSVKSLLVSAGAVIAFMSMAPGKSYAGCGIDFKKIANCETATTKVQCHNAEPDSSVNQCYWFDAKQPPHKKCQELVGAPLKAWKRAQRLTCTPSLDEATCESFGCVWK